MGNIEDIAVVHLVRACNGLQPFLNFLDSYRQFPGGIGHNFVVIFKGFEEASELEPYREHLTPFHHTEILIPDIGYDLHAYAIAVRKLNNPYVCFLNSFSVLLDYSWLAKLATAINRDRIGLAGGTGSYESMYSNQFVDRLDSKAGSLTSRLRTALRSKLNRLIFNPFPNVHIRTNGFMISSRLMCEISPRHVLTKQHAYQFENGKSSLTNKVLAMSLRPVVVGRDGVPYEKEDWPKSFTFRQQKQENLLIGDNQTRQYVNADFKTRRYLSQLAWGDQADTGPA